MRAVLPVLLLLVLAVSPPMPATATACSGGPENDCIASAIEWFAQPTSYTNAGATVEPGEPTCGAMHHTVWLKLEVLAPGTWDSFDVDLDAPYFATIAAYTRDAEGALTLARCASTWSDEESGEAYQPSIRLRCAPGTTYWIQIGSQSANQGGAFHLSESRFWHFNMTFSEPCPFKHTVPNAPSSFRATGAAGSITTSWIEPFPGGRDVALSHYRVYRAPTCGDAFELIGTTTTRGYVDAGLGPDATYCYRAAAVNHLAEGAPSAAASATTWLLPASPRALAASPLGDSEIRLAWQPPASSGGGELSSYRVYRLDDAEGATFVASVGADVRAHTVAGLGRGVAATFAVSAVTAAGEGALSDAAGATTWQLPGAPRDVRAQPTALPGARVTWSAPADDVPFTHYRIYRASSPDATPLFLDEVPRATTTYQDGTLRLLSPAYYEVRASNPAGESAASPRGCAAWPAESPFGRC